MTVMSTYGLDDKQEQERERSALRVSAAALREERDQRQHRPWILRLFDRRLPSVLQQITDIESRWEELSTERRGLQAAVLQAESRLYSRRSRPR